MSIPQLTYAAAVWLWLSSTAPPARAERLPVRQFTTIDGLAHNHINRIKIDADGFLWFCTDNGISRFDGRQFFTLTTADGIPHPDVNDVVQDKQGAFWMATDGGIARLQLRSPGASDKPVVETFRSAEHPSDHYDAIELDPAGRLWAGGHEGLYEIERNPGGVVIRHRNEGLPRAPVARILASRRGGLWVATAAGAAYRAEEGAVTPVQPSPLGQNAFAQALHEDRSGRVWVGYRTGGLCLLEPEAANGKFAPEFCLDRHGRTKADDIRSILESKDGELWIASPNAGLCEFDRRSRRLQCYAQAEGLPEKRVLRLLEDAERNLWLGTGSSGVLRIARSGFARFDSNDGVVTGHLPWLTSAKSGGLLVGTCGRSPDSRVDLLRNRKIETVWRATGDPDGYPIQFRCQGMLEASRGSIWIFSGEYLYRFQAGDLAGSLSRQSPRRFAQVQHVIYRTIHEDGRARIWASTKPELDAGRQGASYVLRQEGPDTGFQPIPGIEKAMSRVEKAIDSDVWVNAIEHDPGGSVWLGIASNRRVHSQPVTTLLRYHPDGRLEEFGASDGVPAANINDIHLARDGRLWLATQTGLTSLDPGGAERPRFVTHGVAQGLSSDEVWSITEDDSGRIYAGTANGVDRLDLSTGRVHHFTASDGLGQGRILAAARTTDGRLWFASENEIARLDPGPAPLTQPRAFLVSPAGPLELPHNRSYFEAEFTSPSYGSAPPMFQYRLSGQDDRWGPPVRENIVRYAGMSPGSYRLEARAVDPGGQVSEPVSLVFQVHPPFWRTWWFLALMAAAGMAGLYAAHRFRVEQLLHVERIRVRIASDLHDDIGSTLAQVSMLGELAKRSLNGSHPAATEHIEKMATASRDAVAAMSDIVWSIHPRNDRLSDLAQRMRRFASEMLSSRDIDFSFDLPAEASDLTLPPEARRDLLLIFKESINNAARHSGCSLVRAEFAVEPGRARLTVEDDGKGIGEGARNGNGLLNMRARAEKLGGSLQVEPGRDGRGTRIAAIVPILPVRTESRWNK